MRRMDFFYFLTYGISVIFAVLNSSRNFLLLTAVFEQDIVSIIVVWPVLRTSAVDMASCFTIVREMTCS